jgi:hypothetical protein
MYFRDIFAFLNFYHSDNEITLLDCVALKPFHHPNNVCSLRNSVCLSRYNFYKPFLEELGIY